VSARRFSVVRELFDAARTNCALDLDLRARLFTNARGVAALLVEEVRHLPVGGKSFQRGLREHESPVDGDLEHAALAGDEFDLGIRKSGGDFRDQTGRLRQVGSLHAVLDRDLHGGDS